MNVYCVLAMFWLLLSVTGVKGAVIYDIPLEGQDGHIAFSVGACNYDPNLKCLWGFGVGYSGGLISNEAGHFHLWRIKPQTGAVEQDYQLFACNRKLKIADKLVKGMAVDPNGIWVLGDFSKENSLLRLNKAGDVLFEKKAFGDILEDEAGGEMLGISLFPDGSLLMWGLDRQCRGMLAGVNGNGEIVWQKRFDRQGAGDRITGCVIDSSGQIYAVGLAIETDYTSRIIVRKLSAADLLLVESSQIGGTMQWARRHPTIHFMNGGVYVICDVETAVLGVKQKVFFYNTELDFIATSDLHTTGDEMVASPVWPDPANNRLLTIKYLPNRITIASFSPSGEVVEKASIDNNMTILVLPQLVVMPERKQGVDCVLFRSVDYDSSGGDGPKQSRAMITGYLFE